MNIVWVIAACIVIGTVISMVIVTAILRKGRQVHRGGTHE